MSLVQELQAMTDDYILKRQPVDVYFKSNVLLWKLLTRGNTYPGGKKIFVPLEYGPTNRGSYGPQSELPINKVNILTAAYFEYAAYYATLTYDMDDDLQNTGEQALVNIVKSKLQNAEKSIRDIMGSQIYNAKATSLAASSDPNAKPFVGLGDMFDTDTSKAYGEITEADLSYWSANVVSDAKTMSFKFMQELRREASLDVNDEDKPDLYMTTEILKDAFERTQHVQVRYSSKSLVNAGFDNILFKGAPIVADGNQASGYVDAFNTKYLDVKTHVKRNFTKPQWQSPIRQPDLATANIRWAGQLICTNRAAHARASNVSEPA